MKTKGAKRRKIPQHYIETLIALDTYDTTGEVAKKLFISYQGLHERMRRMNEWFGPVVVLKWRHHYLTETGRKLMKLSQSGLTDAEILEEMLENGE